MTDHADTEHRPTPELSSAAWAIDGQWNQSYRNRVREIRSRRTGHETRLLLAGCRELAYSKADDMIRDGVPEGEREIMAKALYGEALRTVACLYWFSLQDALKAVREPASGARTSC